MSTIAQANYPHHRKPARSSLSTHIDAADTAGAAYIRPISADEDEGVYIFDTPWTRYLWNLFLNTALLLLCTTVLARLATVIVDHATAVTDLIKTESYAIPELRTWGIVDGRIVSLVGWSVAALYILTIPFLAQRSAGEYQPSFKDFRTGILVAALLVAALEVVAWVGVVGVLVWRDLYFCGGSMVQWVNWGMDYVNETEVAMEQYRLVKSGRARLVNVEG